MFQLFLRTSPHADWAHFLTGTIEEVQAMRSLMRLGSTRGNQWRIVDPNNEITEGTF